MIATRPEPDRKTRLHSDTPTTVTSTTVHAYLCIGCPLGCRLEVEEITAGEQAGEIVEVRGFACKRGADYARQEHHAPQRMVTTTVAVTGGRWPRLPVRSAMPVPKALVIPVCQELAQLHICAPITRGQVIVPNILNSGVDIIATRSLEIYPG